MAEAVTEATEAHPNEAAEAMVVSLLHKCRGHDGQQGQEAF